MRISKLFPSAYLSASDLDGREHRCIIEKITTEMLSEEEKPALKFEGRSKVLILNKTNAGIIAESYGDESDAWSGKPIILYPTKVDFKGKQVDAVRVKIPPPPLKESLAGDEVPF